MKILISLFISVCMLMPATVSASTFESSVMQENVQKKKKSKKAEAEVTYEVHLHCEDCVNKVTENLAFLKGVKDLEVSLEKQSVWIKYDPAKAEEGKFRSVLKELGYEVHPVVEKPEK